MWNSRCQGSRAVGTSSRAGVSGTGREQEIPLTGTQDMPAITAGTTHLSFCFFGSVGVLPFTLRDFFCSALLAALGGAGFLHPAFLQGKEGEEGGGRVTGKLPTLPDLQRLQQGRHCHHGACVEEFSSATLSQNIAKISIKQGWSD